MKTSVPKAFGSAEDWHSWFATQAGWTRPTRQWLYRRAGLDRARTVLEVGCGTGIITGEIARLTGASVVGLDIEAGMLEVARRSAGDVLLVQGDAHSLPFPEQTFDTALCHYLLLWVADPAQAVAEMARVVRPGGRVLACAEPDYGGRVDYPPELLRLGYLQADGLRLQGANPEIGRQLGEFFSAAGLHTTVGVMAGQWITQAAADAGFTAEWAVRRHDLQGLLSPEELDQLEEIDRRALETGRRVLFVPTFYALGEKGLN